MNLDHWFTYLEFVHKRHDIWEQRQAGAPQPWTEDPILRERKFTNVFRVLDPGSQFVFELAPEDDRPLDVLTRLFLYRHTGRIEAWRWLHEQVTPGWITTNDLPGLFEIWSPYRTNGAIFTNAYLVYPQSGERGTDKLRSIIDLTRRLVDNGSFTDFLMADTQPERFACLRQNKGVADFMSMQILTDWGYTPHAEGDYEDVFIQPGPGAVRGAALLDPTRPTLDVLLRCWRELTFDGPELALDAVGENYRPLSLMDVQNTLCEYSKYARYSSQGKTTGRDYVPAHPGPQEAPTLPAHWL